jgi:hypothetical protein
MSFGIGFGVNERFLWALCGRRSRFRPPVLSGHQFGRQCGGFDRNGSQNGYQDNTLTALVCPARVPVRTLPMRDLGYRRREIAIWSTSGLPFSPFCAKATPWLVQTQIPRFRRWRISR